MGRVQKAYFNETGDLVIEVVGIPFGSPNRRDTDGDYFDESTDIGPLREVYSYFDHRKSANYLPENINPFGKGLIGTAQYVEKSGEGHIYRIIVDRRKRYKELLKQMADEGLLGASSETNEREDDPAIPGRIKSWHVTSVDLTPTPANSDARVIGTYNTLVKSISEGLMEAELVTTATEETPASVETAAQADRQQEADSTAEKPVTAEASSETPLVERIQAGVQKALSEKLTPEEDQPEEGAEGNEAETVKLLKSVSEQLFAALARIEALESKLADIAAKQVEESASTKKHFDDFEEALVGVGETVAQAVAQAITAKPLSKAEKAVERTVQKSSSAGISAPVQSVKRTQSGAAIGRVPADW